MTNCVPRAANPVPTRRVSSSWVLGLFTVTYTFGFIDRMLVAVLGQPIKAELGLTDLELGIMGGLTFAAFNAVLSIPVARLAERFNRVRIVALGVALWSVATMACGMVGSFAPSSANPTAGVCWSCSRSKTA
jgi:MFS family permease